MPLTSLEVCAGAGGQAIGVEDAGFEHVELVEVDSYACETLRKNRPHWVVVEKDLRKYSALHLKGIDLVAGGVPCPPFSKAGRQLGADDERDLFPVAVELVDQARPQAVMLENVRGLLDEVFTSYREKILRDLAKLGYVGDWKLLNACHYGVPQLRPRAIFVAMKPHLMERFSWPEKSATPPPTVGESLFELMSERGWKGADIWRQRAASVAPTLVGGSKKHGGPDLGPTRAKLAWRGLSVDGMGIADEAPSAEFVGLPRLTVRMAAKLQGFPDSWEFSGKKTAAYRQIGNAFPPPVARAVAGQIVSAINMSSRRRLKRA